MRMDDPVRQIKGLVLLVLYSISFVEGEIRCYCNESGCVTTSYMCKSQLGMCYTHVKKYKDNGDTVKSAIVSGCVDTLQEEPRIRTCAVNRIGNNIAESNETEIKSANESNDVEMKEIVVIEHVEVEADETDNNVDDSEPDFFCCTYDMCNYIDSNELSDIINQDKRVSTDGISSKRTHSSPKTQQDLWFKAAVIAVPIAGGFILILLVLLAVRMLRTDSRQHKRLIQIRRERSLTKAQLYVTDHFIDKDKNVVLSDNQIYTNNHSHVHHSQNSTREHSHSHRNSNCPRHHHKQNAAKVTTSREGHTYEQIVTPNSETNTVTCDHKCNSSRTSPYPSLIVWGKSNQTNSADVV